MNGEGRWRGGLLPELWHHTTRPQQSRRERKEQKTKTPKEKKKNTGARAHKRRPEHSGEEPQRRRRGKEGGVMKRTGNETIIMLRQVGVFLVSMSSNHPVNELSSARPQSRASSSHFPLAPVLSGHNQHRLPGTPPDQAKAHSLHKPPHKKFTHRSSSSGKKKEENSHL